MPDIFTVTVSQITRRLAGIVKEDTALSDLYVTGEISNYTCHKPTGHCYFTLKDSTASIKCVIFKSYADRINIPLQSGMSVILHGSVKLYERDGTCQLYVTEAFEEGTGEAYLAFLKAKQLLEKEGYFAKKREIPIKPSKICIITSEKGAALQDMLNIIGRRRPIAEIILIPVTVQGVLAAPSMISAINLAQSTDSDVIIIGRGGGSAEDLSAFNDIELAKALFNSRIPTISAVGHETDFTIIDFVADKRAPTPSAAAELATAQTCEDILNSNDRLLENIKRRFTEKLDKLYAMLQIKEKQITALSPQKKLDSYERECRLLHDNIRRQVISILDNYEAAINAKADFISALNPMALLSRGYSIVYKDNTGISSVKQLALGDDINIRLNDGVISAKISDITTEKQI